MGASRPPNLRSVSRSLPRWSGVTLRLYTHIYLSLSIPHKPHHSSICFTLRCCKSSNFYILPFPSSALSLRTFERLASLLIHFRFTCPRFLSLETGASPRLDVLRKLVSRIDSIYIIGTNVRYTQSIITIACSSPILWPDLSPYHPLSAATVLTANHTTLQDH